MVNNFNSSDNYEFSGLSPCFDDVAVFSIWCGYTFQKLPVFKEDRTLGDTKLHSVSHYLVKFSYFIGIQLSLINW